MRFRSPTDRIYLATTAGMAIRDVQGDRSVLINKDGSDVAVVWNPGIDNARAMEDFGDDDWTRMVCVEVCNIRDAAVDLAPGGSHTMGATFELHPEAESGSTPR